MKAEAAAHGVPAWTPQALRERLARHAVLPLPLAGRRHAAVALVCCEAGHGAEMPGLPVHSQWCTDPALLLTRRAATLRAHAGQWALPGGRIDDGETPEQAALRELREEVALALPAHAVIGRLDDYATRSGYVITPVLVWGGAAHGLQPDPAEVASVHRVPVAELLRPDAPLLCEPEGPHPHGLPDPLQRDEPDAAALPVPSAPASLAPASSAPASTAPASPAAVPPAHPVLRMPVGSGWIAAPTAAFLYQFREWLLLERSTRVAHFDQPRFAWR